MKVFISWSGERSKQTAIVLSSWIRQVIQATETWISLDIEKGNRWDDQIKIELEQSKIGIICLNKDNLKSEWILFEAGAISKTKDSQVCTFLLDISPANINPPLGQFQHTLFQKEDIRKLIHTINNKLNSVGEKSIPENDLNQVFDIFYHVLDEKLSLIQMENPKNEIIERPEREILEEILQLIRIDKEAERKEMLQTLYETIKQKSNEYDFLRPDLNTNKTNSNNNKSSFNFQ